MADGNCPPPDDHTDTGLPRRAEGSLRLATEVDVGTFDLFSASVVEPADAERRHPHRPADHGERPPRVYETSRQVSDEFKANTPIMFNDQLPKWNYRAVPR